MKKTFTQIACKSKVLRKGSFAFLLISSLFASNIVFGQAQTIGSFPSMQGGFENQTTGNAATFTAAPTTAYTVSDANAVLNIEATTVRSGSQAAKLTISSSASHFGYAPSTTGITSGGTYTVQWYTMQGTTSTTTKVALSCTGTTFGGVAGTTTVGATWTKNTATVTAGTGTSGNGLLELGANSSGKNAFFDDICVYSGAVDNTAPTAASAAAATSTSATTADITWTGLANAGDGGGYVIVRSTSATAVTLNTNGIYGLNNTSATGGGTVVAIVPGVTGTNTFSDAGLTTGTTYYYSIFAADKAFNYAAAATCNVTPSAPLPVTFSSIQASQLTGNGSVSIQWDVADETSISSYAVEKSTNGVGFSVIGTVNATGNNNSSVVYNWTDPNAVAGKSYYRIEAIGNGGEINYSQQVVINAGSTNPASLTVYPNPVTATGTINLQFTNTLAGRYSVRLINNTGQVLSVEGIDNSGNGVYALPLGAHLAKGLYHLEAIGPDDKSTIIGVEVE